MHCAFLAHYTIPYRYHMGSSYPLSAWNKSWVDNRHLNPASGRGAYGRSDAQMDRTKSEEQHIIFKFGFRKCVFEILNCLA